MDHNALLPSGAALPAPACGAASCAESPLTQPRLPGFLSSGPGADVFVFQDDVTDQEARGPLKEGREHILPFS